MDFFTELHQKNVKSMKETESKLKSKLTKAESEVSDLGTVQQDLEKLRSEFDTLSKNHLRTTEELNRYEKMTLKSEDVLRSTFLRSTSVFDVWI